MQFAYKEKPFVSTNTREIISMMNTNSLVEFVVVKDKILDMKEKAMIAAEIYLFVLFIDARVASRLKQRYLAKANMIQRNTFFDTIDNIDLDKSTVSMFDKMIIMFIRILAKADLVRFPDL